MIERFNVKEWIEDAAAARWARRLPKSRFGWIRHPG
jgi:hypothetical protein